VLTSSGGERMLGFLAGISSFFGLISATMVAISSLPLVAYTLAAIWTACMSQSKARFRSPLRERTPLGLAFWVGGMGSVVSPWTWLLLVLQG
jgi:hypothetical protein